MNTRTQEESSIRAHIQRTGKLEKRVYAFLWGNLITIIVGHVSLGIWVGSVNTRLTSFEIRIETNEEARNGNEVLGARVGFLEREISQLENYLIRIEKKVDNLQQR